MKFTVRRKDAEIKDRETMERLLDSMRIGRLGLTTDEGPYVVPMNYIYDKGCIYIHSAMKGRKIEALKKNSLVCFLVDDPGSLVVGDDACSLSQLFKSVMCFGHAEFVEEENEKKDILEKMVRKMISPDKKTLPLDSNNLKSTAVIRIKVEQMTGKSKKPKA